VRQLRTLGINTAEALLGLAYVDPEGLAQELEMNPEGIADLIEALRQHISPDVLELIDAEYQSSTELPLGAELGPAPDVGVIAEYDEE
jgi:hypothetical protein